MVRRGGFDWSTIWFASTAGDCELSGVFSILPEQIGEKTAPGIDEPVTDLADKDNKTKVLHNVYCIYILEVDKMNIPE